MWASRGWYLVTALAVVISAADTVSLIAVSGLGTLANGFAAWFLVQRQARLALHSATSRVVAASVAGLALAVILVWLVPSPVGAVAGLTIGDVLLLALVSAGHGWRPPAWRVALAEARAHLRLMIIQLAHIAQFRVGTIILHCAGLGGRRRRILDRVTDDGRARSVAAALTSSSLPLMGAAHTQDDRAGLSSVFDEATTPG